MRVHFIGVGERTMGDLAAVLCQQGHQVTGSDVSFGKHTSHSTEGMALVLVQPGWFPQRITECLDRVIVGRRIQLDNPELQAAQQLGIPVYSYPEYIYDYAQDKQRIVIVGGEEKTLTCVLVLHVLAFLHKAFDYVIDAPTLQVSVQLSDAPIIILGGDMAPSSPINLQSQSLCYQHNMALISGVGWECNDDYPTLEAYLQQLARLADASPKGGTLVYYEGDGLIKTIGSQPRTDVKGVPYRAHNHRYADGKVYLITPRGDMPFQYTDTASMSAISGAQQIVNNLAVSDQQFYEALATFLMY
ncbi:MAG: Mur ligase domain-containing protein [Amoebophilaceae bacterium]|jgi:UDP-N-acetylmuramate: L-alanyl-gamma-D-glutamyl-meso-diaminopimelate ligase|nr:Mur ligase domain-containing protein [Amoebophilaceae bacterium]